MATQTEELLQTVRGRVKFNLHSRRGWQDLQSEVFSLRFSKSLSRPDIEKLAARCSRWLHLFKRLDFIASTRPVSNS